MQPDSVYRDLAASRAGLKRAMRDALACRSPEEKKALFAKWKAEHGQFVADMLARYAKDKVSAKIIAEWKLPNPT